MYEAMTTDRKAFENANGKKNHRKSITLSSSYARDVNAVVMAYTQDPDQCIMKFTGRIPFMCIFRFPPSSLPDANTCFQRYTLQHHNSS